MKKTHVIIMLLCTVFFAGCRTNADAEFTEAVLEESSDDIIDIETRDNNESGDESKDEEESSVSLNETAQKLEELMEAFGQAYFCGDVDSIKKFLVEDYEWDIDTYEYTVQADIVRVKGIQQIDEQNLRDCYELSIQFRFPGEDSMTYLSVEWQKEGDDWKVIGYGLEK